MRSPACSVAGSKTQGSERLNRIERLYAVVELLRARAPDALSARAIADALSVSVRTVQRDLTALGEAGVPIWSQAGQGGGWSIDPTHTLPPLNLTAEEAVALTLAVADTGDRPFRDASERA